MNRLPERFQEKIAPCPITGCWFWLGWDSGAKDGDSYGKVKWRGVAWMAHRIIYCLLIGDIPHGYVLDHSCKQHFCVNPHHLEPVPQMENVRRGDAVLFSIQKRDRLFPSDTYDF